MVFSVIFSFISVFDKKSKHLNTFSLLIQIYQSKPNGLIILIQHYFCFGVNHVELFVSIHFISFCFMIQITSFLVHFNFVAEKRVQELIQTERNTKDPNWLKLSFKPSLENLS